MMKKVIDFCSKHNIFTAGEKVLAAVSGGADSMCLLHLLLTLSESLGITVCAAHFNHCLRGDESDGDEAFVKDYCENLNIPCYTGRGDVNSYAAEKGLGTEEAARELRYAFLEETAEKHGASRIATAHNAEDNLETMLLNLARGTGLKGLCGIPPVRGNIVRPLLTVSRDDIISYLDSHGIPHKEDSTNAEDSYTRNKLRHRVLPVLREVNPSAAGAALSAAELLREDEKYLSSLADEFIEREFKNGRVSAEKLTALPFPVSSRVIRSLCAASLSSEHVRSVLDLACSSSPSASLSLPSATIRREYKDVVFAQEDIPVFPPVTLKIGEITEIPELSLRISCKKITAPSTIHKRLNTFVFNCDNLYGNISVRPRKEGDFIRLSENGGRKTLKKLFTEKKIPALRRNSVPVIADDESVLAVYGIGQEITVFPAPGGEAVEVIIEEIKDIS